MEYIDCANRLTDNIIRNTINFWSKNSFEHITSIMNLSKNSGGILYPEYEKNLKGLFDKYQNLYEDTSKSKNTNIYFLSKVFLDTNQEFICLLEKLKFEGFNGNAFSFEKLYHWLYEQKYAKGLILSVYPIKDKYCENLLFTTEFYKTNPFRTLNKCIFTQLYFWSIIGAQHPNFILDENTRNSVPEKIRISFDNTCASFNLIAFKLSNIINMQNKNELRPIYDFFKKTNDNFLYYLYDLKNYTSKDLNHIISEHTYLKDLLSSFDKLF